MPAASAAQLNFVDYAPYFSEKHIGSWWTYQNVANPSDTYTNSLLGCLTFTDDYGSPVPACRFGEDLNYHGIIYSGSNSFTYYARVNNGTLMDFPDVTIGNFTDGAFFNLASPTNFKLLRVWDNLDSMEKSIYGIDPLLSNLIIEVTYDSDETENYHNNIVESNLGISLPNYAVTGISWFAPNIGEIVNMDISAQSGAMNERYDLVDYNIASPVRINGAIPTYYSTFQAAYDDAGDGDFIQISNAIFNEDLSIDDITDKLVSLEGGYNNAFTAITGRTTINGSMVVSNGKVIIQNGVIELL